MGERQAALAVLAATDLLIHPLSINGDNTTSGDYLLDKLSTMLLYPPEED
ncbi:hypothetical protein AB0D83_19880 [Streptomyces decoyicus]